MSDRPKSAVDEQKVIGGEAVEQSQSEKEATQAAGDYQSVQESKKDSSTTSLQVKVHSPFKEYYNGQAFSVSAENDTGPFDILPNHHNFITLLKPCDILIRTPEKGDQKIRISGGIMHVKANQAIVFLDV